MKGRGVNLRKNKRFPLLTKGKKSREEDNISQGARLGSVVESRN
jgi:hypothetical protein